MPPVDKVGYSFFLSKKTMSDLEAGVKGQLKMLNVKVLDINT